MPTCSADGTELFFVEVGTGLPCLVMHGGLGWDHTYMHPWLDPLGDKMHLVYYDHRGNGRSGRPPVETLTHAQFSADAEALRRHLGFDRVAVMGHSYGGFIALEYALRYPRHLSHLILVGTAPALDYLDEVMANARRRGATPEVVAAFEMVPDTDEAMARRARLIAPLYFHSFDPGLVDRILAHTVFSSSAAARGRQLRQMYNVSRTCQRSESPR